MTSQARPGHDTITDRPTVDVEDGPAHDVLDEIGGGQTLTGDVLDVAHDALDRAYRVLGDAVDGLSAVDDGSLPDTRPAVLGLLRTAWDVATGQARAHSDVSAEPGRLIDLIDLLNAVHAAEEYISTGGGEGSTSQMNRVRERLQSIETADSLEEMIDRAPVAVAGLGFDRVLLSRIADSQWIPERVYFKGDTRWAEEVLEALAKEPLLLDTSLLETQMMRRAVPLRVVDPANRPLMHRLMITLSMTRGYVAAPITDRGVVVGFLHADCYYQSRVPSQADVDALWLFSQSLGALLARQSLVEKLRDVRREATKSVSILGGGGPRTLRDHPSTATTEPVSPAETPTRRTHALHDIVTQREIEVLQLMSEGASNEQISRKLVISVGTVKSHVKRILRKLDVANRAEAASLWLRSEYGRMPGTADHR